MSAYPCDICDGSLVACGVIEELRVTDREETIVTENKDSSWFEGAIPLEYWVIYVEIARARELNDPCWDSTVVEEVGIDYGEVETRCHADDAAYVTRVIAKGAASNSKNASVNIEEDVRRLRVDASEGWVADIDHIQSKHWEYKLRVTDVGATRGLHREVANISLCYGEQPKHSILIVRERSNVRIGEVSIR